MEIEQYLLEYYGGEWYDLKTDLIKNEGFEEEETEKVMNELIEDYRSYCKENGITPSISFNKL